jgi:2-polyprenyl-3-methyl-5-hydroxy-6-metoxy-1,4-benzoquinol methylase
MISNELRTLEHLHEINMSAYGLVQKKDIVSMLKFLPKQASVLDVGCGFGGPSQEASEFFKVSACDVSTPSTNIRFREAVMENRGIDFKWSTPDRLPYDNESFDGLLLYAVIEHVRDKQSLLRECSRVLKENGVIFMFRAVNSIAFAEKFARLLGYPTHGTDVVTRDEILEATQQTGFDILKWGYQGWLPENGLPRLSIFIINALLTKIPLINRLSHDYYFICRKSSH